MTETLAIPPLSFPIPLSWDAARAMLKDEPLPALLVDRDAFDRNVRASADKANSPLDELAEVVEQGRGPKRLLTSVAFIAAGAARGFVIQYLGVFLDVLPDDQLLFRLISGPLFVYGALGSLAIIESSRQRHEKTLSALVAEKAELDELRGGIRERIRIQKAELLKQVQTVLNPAMEQVRNELTRTGAADLSLKLRSVVENVVRPLSHNIGTSTTAIDLGIKAVTAKSNLRATSKYKIDRISVGGLLVPELVMFATASIAR